VSSEQAILVTGGAGFIGVNLVRFLLREEPAVRVVNLDALTYAGNLESLADILDHPRHCFVHGSIADAELIAKLCREHRFAGILNLAAESHVDRSIREPGRFVATNVLGTQVLLEALREQGAGRFLQVSTDEVYGSLASDDPPCRENAPLRPRSPYSASKAAADHLVAAYHHTYGMDAVITRCTNNYGPWQFPEKLIPLAINNLRKQQAVPIYGDGRQIRDWLYVADHCRGIWLAFRRGLAGAVYNFGGGNQVDNLSLVNRLLTLVEAGSENIRFVADRLGHDRRYALDTTLAQSVLGWQPQVTLDDGLRRTVAWYRENQPWLDRIVAGEYRHYYERMYGQG